MLGIVDFKILHLLYSVCKCYLGGNLKRFIEEVHKRIESWIEFLGHGRPRKGKLNPQTNSLVLGIKTIHSSRQLLIIAQISLRLCRLSACAV